MLVLGTLLSELLNLLACVFDLVGEYMLKVGNVLSVNPEKSFVAENLSVDLWKEFVACSQFLNPTPDTVVALCDFPMPGDTKGFPRIITASVIAPVLLLPF